MRFLDRHNLIEINKQFEAGTVLNEAAVTMATQQISRQIYGTDVLPTLAAKAAYLARAIARHHMFKDGNKRTALRAVVQFLTINGHAPPPLYIDQGGTASSNYDIREWINRIVDAKEDALDIVVGNFSTWLRSFITHEARPRG